MFVLIAGIILTMINMLGYRIVAPHQRSPEEAKMFFVFNQILIIAFVLTYTFIPE